MRISGIVLLAIIGCTKAPQAGTMEWTAKQYGSALLQTNYDEMRRYALTESTPPLTPEELKGRLSGLHVIKQCPMSSNAEKTSYTTLVLIAGSMNNSVYGLEVTTIKKESTWQVEKASYSLDPEGKPKRYLRDCTDDSSAEKKPIQGL